MVDVVSDTEILCRYSDEFYTDKACVTRHAYGAGFAYYMGAGLDADILMLLIADILKRASIISTSNGCEQITRGDNVTFMLNHDSFDVEIKV